MLGNRVEIRSRQFAGGGDTRFPRTLAQGFEQLGAAFRALGNDNIIKGFDPLVDLIDKTGLEGNFCFCGHWNRLNNTNFSVYSRE